MPCRAGLEVARPFPSRQRGGRGITHSLPEKEEKIDYLDAERLETVHLKPTTPEAPMRIEVSYTLSVWFDSRFWYQYAKIAKWEGTASAYGGNNTPLRWFESIFSHQRPQACNVGSFKPPRTFSISRAVLVKKTHDISGEPTCGEPLKKWLIGRPKVPVINRCGVD